MTSEELIVYDKKLMEYFDIITDNRNVGKIDINKFDRLATKIEEWYDEARKGRR